MRKVSTKIIEYRKSELWDIEQDFTERRITSQILQQLEVKRTSD